MKRPLSHNIILPKYLEIVKKNKAAEKIACPSEGEAEGGGGGPEAEQVRYGVKIPPRPSRSPTVVGRSVKVRSPDFRQKKFGF